MRPTSIPELAELLGGDGPFEIVGSGSKRGLCLPLGPKPHMLDVAGLSGIVEWAPEDQVVVARAGTRLAELQAELETRGQCLPLPDPAVLGAHLAGFPGTVGGLVSMNLPHALFGTCGGPRDWVLGMTVVRPDGTVAKCGSKAVKSVAGYDVHKLLIGARGTLGVVAEVILRLAPLGSLPRPDVEIRMPYDGRPLWIQRTLRSDFDAAVASAGDRLYAADRASCTLWAWQKADESLPRFGEDWVIRGGCGASNLRIDNGALAQLMVRAKRALDPQGKLNPGAMGVV